MVTKTCEKQFKRKKDLSWLMVSEVLDHGQLALLFLGQGEAEHRGGRVGGGAKLPPTAQHKTKPHLPQFCHLPIVSSNFESTSG
jgi:hypothetical protein